MKATMFLLVLLVVFAVAFQATGQQHSAGSAAGTI